MTLLVNQQEISDIDIGMPEYWTYKSEGAMNVVLSYTGPFNENLNGLVLRVKKQSNGGSNLEKEIELFNFVSKVMTPLLGEKYVFCGSMINITQDFLEKLDSLIFKQRPITRSTIRLDTKLPVAFLIMDLTKLDSFNISIDHDSILRSPVSHRLTSEQYQKQHPSHDKEKVICIEIKPKWGFLPSNSLKYMASETRDTKASTCRYCMHQHLKFQENSIGDISNYCPIDLFSGDPKRQEYSIKEMINHPQNNLKIYYNGVLSFTGSLGGGAERDQLSNCKILSSLLYENDIIRVSSNGQEEGVENIDIHSTIDAFSKLVTIILNRETILSSIKKVQLFDEYDIEGIYYIYNKLNGNESKNQSLDISKESQDQLNQLSTDQMKDIINRFMISCTAKDCSIMISFTLGKSITSIQDLNTNLTFINSLDETTNNNTDNNSSNNTVTYKIGVVDLDTKKQSAIPKYYELDREIVKTFKKSIKSIKSCK
ncbi:hypothetical protein DICPUDRAFT_43505 [Dictyostelium purpureum]|uniref:Inositol-pentakisphosphate 2-kinase n=1 Tax=Dictyostelium purpureum TaxID=5786 RepID=F1A493_DICPU|nr:uncharacterized protein DICPUDRAFT_43505 [Dictyostelium purpureum]EGC28988.1 hypothetical protein DICPUDRAFT_43505 [Dictyostelium purpureum]|eukprot:XP_003294485.1 hypothetical protein DICPUDRAFT_43505 [Dictyostelium purpureum]